MLVALGSFAYKFYSLKEQDSLKLTLVENIKKIASKIPIELLKFKEQEEECISYSLYHQPTFSMSFFVLKMGHLMPLHDHPGMTVFMKVLQGKLLISTYEVVSKENADGTLNCKKLTRIITPESPDSFLVLEPNGGPNLHSFISLSEQTVFLDIIGPPYNDYDRPCTYYRDCSENMSLHERQDYKFTGKDSVELNGISIPLNVVNSVKIVPIPYDYACKAEIYEPGAQ